MIRKIVCQAYGMEQSGHDRQSVAVANCAQPSSFASHALVSSGFTLIEVMVAMLIMLVGLMALLAALGVAMEHNTRNRIRSDVVQVAEDTMNAMKNQSITATFNPLTTVSSSIRGVPKQYAVRRQTTALPSGGIQYQVAVTSVYKNLSTTHTIVSLRGKE